MQLQNKVAIVTGGARGIGAGIARCLADAGAQVAVVDLDGDAAEATAAALPVRGIGLRADVSQENEMEQAAQQIVQRLGALDFLINNAGGGKPGSG
ncbi:MAG TPA: SDR family NAD(P)-dependent oxidoreductase, partial [Nevskiaceae bacterium]|nr:SDR family NAD(P)-dependent oxidoreductase [Nevskiaceae bacterium]